MSYQARKFNKKLLRDIEKYFGEDHLNYEYIGIEELKWYLATVFLWYKQANKRIRKLQKELANKK